MDNHHPKNNPPGIRPPRKELQGPRPAPLKVRNDSYKIKKPPVAPPQQLPQQPPRPPVIIYTVSPKVIHTSPGDFMTLVQRLTGSNSTSSSSSSASVSPAARFASIEKTKMPLEGNMDSTDDHLGFVEGVKGGWVENPGNIPGILSPGPGSLPPVSPNFFSPLLRDPKTFGLHHGLGSSNGSFMPSPSANFCSPSTMMLSPTSLDLLRNFLQ